MKKNMFLEALKTDSGKGSFALMILTIVLTILISTIWADKSWSTTGSFISCFVSITAGGEFCKEMLKNR